MLCTDGEAAAGLGSVDSMRAIGNRRHAEAVAAAAALATDSPVEMCFLELPDGALDGRTVELEAALAPLLADADLIVAPWPGDGHPDHAAAGPGGTPHLRRDTAARVPGVGVALGNPGRPGPGQPGTRAAQSVCAARQGDRDPDLCLAAQRRRPDPHSRGPGALPTRSRAWSSPPSPNTTARRPASSAFFEALHRTTPGGDPWDFARSETEQLRFDQIVDRLGGSRFRSGLELGCSTGQLTRRLARHTDRLLATHASRGIECATGIVELEPSAPDALRQQLASTYRLGIRERSHDHVHGTNFGIRGDTLLSAGNWPTESTAEDHGLWHAVTTMGRRTLQDPAIVVTTSARLIGRAPLGFANDLSNLGRARAGSR